MTTLWLQGKPQAAPCELLFDAWIAADMHAPAQIEQRLLLALAANELTLAKGLQRKLPAARQAWGEQALRIYAAPTAGLRTGATLPPELRTVALAHLAASDAPAALDAWEEGAVQSPLTTQQQSEVAQAIHKGLLKQQPAGLLALLARLPAATLPVRAQEERLRQALSVQAWARVAEWAAALPETSTAEEWRYWQAHALEQTGQNTAALAKFTALARERTFYGFLAADRTGQSYDFATTPLAADPALQAELAARPALRRLREALALQLEPEAKHEWAAVFPALDETQAQLAIRLLDQWDWPDQAQFALAKRGFWRDLEFRFPMRYLREVQTAAAAQQLDPAWIYAVIRQESVFNPQALSGANARGLMQLLPETAKATARRVGLAAPSAAALFQPEANITLGAAYLRQMLNRLDGHLALATAAYNAGPGRPKKWRQDAPADAALWVELIPFRETRGYVKRVLSYRVLYQWRLGLPVQRISTALTDVRP
jgi:soluble lytic murein transglycosylase